MTKYTKKKAMESSPNPKQTHKVGEPQAVFTLNQGETASTIYDDILKNTAQINDIKDIKGVLVDVVQLQMGANRRMDHFEQRMDRMEIKLEELSQAQKSTDESVKRLEISIQALRVAVGSLANTFGFNLEEFVADLLPPYLYHVHNIDIDRLERTYLEAKSFPYEEIDLYGDGIAEGKVVTLLVECQTTVGGGAIKDLAEKFERVIPTLPNQNVIKIVVALNIHPTAFSIAETYQILLIPYRNFYRRN